MTFGGGAPMQMFPRAVMRQWDDGLFGTKGRPTRLPPQAVQQIGANTAMR
ncbi:hypothetical protein LOS78_19205 (plasmid) [Paracoccus sp. MA]|nr:hypothetical protein [Paracoccus sp. MA]UFM67226.1 hypothetical protein LOS78_19205 [Paracoccus sp. MA]